MVFVFVFVLKQISNSFPAPNLSEQIRFQSRQDLLSLRSKRNKSLKKWNSRVIVLMRVNQPMMDVNNEHTGDCQREAPSFIQQ